MNESAACITVIAVVYTQFVQYRVGFAAQKREDYLYGKYQYFF